MANQLGANFFSRLITAIRPDLSRIAYKSEGEVTADDLASEAWLMAAELSPEHEAPPDPGDKAFQQKLLGRLYNRFVKFADKRLKYAVRLDKEETNDSGDTMPNAVAASLAAPEQYEPLFALARDEAAAEADVDEESKLACRFAEAVAYVRLFHAFDQDRGAISDHLLIARCTLRRRVKRAEMTVEIQPSLFDGVASVPPDFVPPPALVGASFRTQKTAHWLQRMIARAQAKLFPRAVIPIRPISPEVS
jgi:hypothetical protein